MKLPFDRPLWQRPRGFLAAIGCALVLSVAASLSACVSAPSSPAAVASTATIPAPSPSAVVAARPSATPAVASTAPAPSPMPTASQAPTAMPEPTLPVAPPVTPLPTVARVQVPSPEQTLADVENVERPMRDLADLAVRLEGVAAAAATPTVNTTGLNYPSGRQDVFWVSDQKLKSYFLITATIALVTPHAYFYVQNGIQVAPNAPKQASDNFETRTYPLIHRYFGTEKPGVDGDTRITILNARIPSVGGYFSSDDQYPRSVSPHSNERNILYINLDSSALGTRNYDATLAHELQHLVAWNVYPAADTWFNEGSSELAMRLTGYSVGGAEGAYSNDPNTQLTGWSVDDSKTFAHYGAGYLFISYFAQHYGGYDLLPQLFGTAGRGPVPFDRYLAQNGYVERFDDVFRDWVIANYLDDQNFASGRYGYKDISIHARADRIDRYPVTRDATVEQYGVQYFELLPAPGDITISITTTTTSKLLAQNAKSGRMQWWSNRGDLMDTTLTRAFDLSGLSKATLQFSTWYDIEDGYDYAYAEVSIDGGRTWKTLPGRYTTDDDPIGHNAGHGYTGRSGGGAKPEWIEEEIDLTPYAGKKVQLRFEHVSDDAFNAPGFAIDDVSIPELAFRDDSEASDNDWQPVGFVRTSNVIPQPFSVQLIETGQSTRVEPIPIDASGHGQFTTTGLGKDFRRAVLAISPMARVTSEPAPVTFSVSGAP